jgi:pimeloyl-ACP methyl ester carboxylesterase
VFLTAAEEIVYYRRHRRGTVTYKSSRQKAFSMTFQDFSTIYADVPEHQKEMLRMFRAAHPYRELNINGKKWRYLAGGQGQ